MATEIDAAEVLSSYTATLAEPHSNLIRDISDLSYSKDIIKAVLVHCIKLSEPGEGRDFLRSAYVGLADFQHLSDQEQSALQAWDAAGQSDLENAGQETLLKLARGLSDQGELTTHLRARVAQEAAALLEELRTAEL